MTVKLAIEILSPLTPDDRDLLAGIAVMTLAIANREMAENRFPDTFTPDEEETEETQEQPCGDLEYTVRPGSEVAEATGSICISPVGHRGRHKYRDLRGGTPITITTEGMN